MFSLPIAFLTQVAPALPRTAVIILTERNYSDLVKDRFCFFFLVTVASLMIRNYLKVLIFSVKKGSGI